MDRFDDVMSADLIDTKIYINDDGRVTLDGTDIDASEIGRRTNLAELVEFFWKVKAENQ